MFFPPLFVCEFLLYFLRCRATFLRISIMDWPRVSAANHAIYGGQRTRYNTCMLSDHRSTYAHTHVAFINVVMHGTSESRAGVTLISAANHVVMHGTSESRATHGTSEYRCTVALLPGTVQSECRCAVQSECRCNAQSECRCNFLKASVAAMLHAPLNCITCLSVLRTHVSFWPLI